MKVTLCELSYFLKCDLSTDMIDPEISFDIGMVGE